MQALIVKWIFKAIFKAIKRKSEWKQMEDYVKKPNELDVKVKQMEMDIDELKNIVSTNVSIKERLRKLEKRRNND